MIETGFIPIKIVPTLSPAVVNSSIFNYLEDTKGKRVTKSFTTISVSPSTADDQKLLELKPTEPVAVMDGVFFLDDGTPFEVSSMRIHYRYMRYSTFINLDQEGLQRLGACSQPFLIWRCPQARLISDQVRWAP